VKLRARYQIRARAPSTNKAYGRELAKYEKWAYDRGILQYPAEYDTVSLYLVTVAEATKSVPMTTRASAAIRAEHRRRNMESPTESPGVVDLMKGIINAHGRPPRQVEPLSKRTLLALLQSLVSDQPSPIDKRTAWLALFCFQVAGRCGDVIKLQVEHFSFQKNGDMVVKFPSLKNVSVSQGFQTIVVPQEGRWCPVRCTKKYFKSLRLSGADFVVPVIAKRVDKFKNLHYLVTRSKAASTAALRLHFRDALRNIGENAEDYGLHSPRRGAVAQLHDAGFSPEDIMIRVGWKTNLMVPLYASQAVVKQKRQSAVLNVAE